MNGMSVTAFSPDASFTRAQAVAVLYRLAGEPEVDYSPVFDDVSERAWYNGAVLWAYEQEIAFGVGFGRFAPDESVSMMQFVTMLHRFVRDYWAYDLAVPTDDWDAEEIAAWAEEAIRWALYEGLLDEADFALDSTATRAACATLLMRLVQRFAEAE